MVDKESVKCPKVVAYPAADEFCGLPTGQTISRMTCRGKFLAIRLGGNDCIIYGSFFFVFLNAARH